MMNGIENRYGFFAGYAAFRRECARKICRLAAFVAFWAGLLVTAHAAGTINVNSIFQRASGTTSQCTLGAAILTANGNTPVDGCTITGTTTAPYTINIPAGTYTLNSVDNTDLQGVPFGLPVIQNTMTLQGAAAATSIIERSSANGTADFGLLIIGQNVNTITINDLTFQNGKGTGFGGGVNIFNGNNALAVNRCVFQNNSTAADGGGIGGIGSPPITIADSSFVNNTAAGHGGAATGLLTITNSDFTGSQAGLGGGALFCTQGGCGIQVTDSTFGNNTTATGPGGAIWAASVTILRSMFENNSANDVNSSAGALSSQQGSITDSYFLNNTVNGSTGGGGGAVVGVNLTITGVTFKGNQAGNSGGAFQGGASTIENSTFIGNQSDPDGGAISSTGSLVLNNVTIFGNKADRNGGGIEGRDDGSDVVRNSIIAGNRSGSVTPIPDCSGTLTSEGHNIIGEADCNVIAVSGDQFGTANAPIDPVLGALAANGGKTIGRNGAFVVPTLALLVGSPALDAGNLSTPGSGGTACAATDQRGISRPVGPACDVGAFEAKQGGEIPTYDLQVANTPSSSEAIVGANFTLTILVSNAGPDTATGISLSDSIAPFAFASFTAPAGWNCTTPAIGASGTVTCTKSSMLGGDSATISLVVRAGAGNLGGSATNTANVTSTGNDTDLTNNSSTTPPINILDPPTDISLTMTGSPNAINVGGTVSYTLTIKNNGPANTDLVQVAENPSASATLVSVTTSQGNCLSLSGQEVCKLGSLANGATATVTVVTTAQAGSVPSITNSATVSAAEDDPNPANNSASVTTTVSNAAPDFSFSMSPTTATVPQGGMASYPVTLTPSGGFTGSVQFNCTGLPAESNCSSVPNPVSVSGSSPVQATLMIQTTAPSAHASAAPLVGFWSMPGVSTMIALCGTIASLLLLSMMSVFRPARRRLAFCALCVMGLLVFCVGCGGSHTGLTDSGTPKGSYTITVTATSGQISHNSTVTVVVGP